MTIGERIRAAREARSPRCSQAALADQLSELRWGRRGYLTRQDVSRWEAGRREPTDWRPFIEQALDIDLSTSNGVGQTGDTDTVAAPCCAGCPGRDRWPSAPVRWPPCAP
jgi:transcriptional regulator with XRE-family HTH domain